MNHPPGGSLKGKTILLISDDEEMIRTCHLILEREGHRVPILSINEGVVEEAQAESPDLIIVDMGGKSWKRRAWRETLRVAGPLARKFARAPVLVVAPPYPEREWPRAHAEHSLAGVALCLLKPLDPVEFLRIATRIFEAMEGMVHLAGESG